MQHCDPDVLSLLALGEPASDADLAHVAGCDECRSSVASLARVVSAVRVDLPDGEAVTPPARVWDQIVAATGVTAATAVPRQGIPSQAAGLSAATGPAGNVVPFTRRPQTSEPVTAAGGRVRSGRRWTSLVAAAALVVGAAGGSLTTRLVTQRPEPSSTVISRSQLAALPLAPSAAGKAVVVEVAGGDRLTVDVTGLGMLRGRFYEVWLIDRSIKKMLPVGILRGPEGQFVIPTGLDLGEYPVVDISVQEPGNPAHSGKSLLRGTLST